MNDAPHPIIAAIADAADDESRARLTRDGARVLLADPGIVADVAFAAADPEDDATTQAAAELLSSALDEARMATENDAPEGVALMDAVSTAIATQDSAQPLAPNQRLRLARIYARAGLAPPSFANLTAEIMAEANPASREMPDIDDLLDPILQEIGDAPQQVHAALGDLLAGLPAELAAMLVSMILARPGAVEARLGLYWLLDAQADLRLAAAAAFLSRAEEGTLPPDIATLLPAIRKWLPDDAARTALDGAIRRQMRGGIASTKAPGATIHRAAASLPDGAGAQSLIAAVQSGSRRGVAMAMLKQGHGVKDAFVIPCASATEQRQTLARILDELETFDIPPAALAEALARGLGEGLALGRLPAPGTIDLAEILGPTALSPAAAGTEDILASIGAAETLADLPATRRTALVKASADWIEHFDQADSWFEDTGALRDALARARTDNGRETAVWKHLGTRRHWWARQFAVSAAILRAAADIDPALWLSFAAVAQALMDGRSLKRIPIMIEIVEMTLEAHSAREGHAVPMPRRDEGNVIGPLLAHAGITEGYLQGYLAALAITPREPSPEAWLGALLGGIEFPGEGALDHLMEFVVIQANIADEDAGDPETTARALAALDKDGLQDWAAGFDDLVAATRRFWPAKSLAADDKRLLRDIGSIAKGADGTTLRAVLPSWIARRHTLRQ